MATALSAPERVVAIQRLTSAYLRTALIPGDSSWPVACDGLTAGSTPLARVQSK